MEKRIIVVQMPLQRVSLCAQLALGSAVRAYYRVGIVLLRLTACETNEQTNSPMGMEGGIAEAR